MQNLFIYASIILATMILTFVATFNYIIVNQEIEKKGNEFEVTIFHNVYYYE